jgi:hypothetical protein
VTIYPSENYYYFGFYDKGLAWSGSLRLAAESRDDGMLQFIYYETFNRWQPSSYGTEVMLGPEDGVTITKLGRFRYKVAYEDVAVVFHLHQLDMTLSPQTILAEGETYVGSLFDESGIGFDLIYSEPMNNFMFLLDTSDAYSERFHDIGDGLVVGKRTGFVYYRDGAYNRSILLGVNYHMSRINSHYDGPFDQLPENYYAEIGFWDYVFKAYPGIKGQVSPYGSFDDETIFAIATYIRYRRISKLDSIRKCIADKGALTQFYQCILDVSND